MPTGYEHAPTWIGGYDLEQEAIKRQKDLDMLTMIQNMEAQTMAKIGGQSVAGQLLGGVLGAGAHTLNSQYKQLQQAAQAQAQYNQQTANPVGQPAGPLAEVKLKAVADSLGLDTDRMDGFTMLAVVLAEIVRKTGIALPIPEKKDFYDALAAAKDDEHDEQKGAASA